MKNSWLKTAGSNPFEQMRVLIIEDNSVDRRLLREQLESLGFYHVQEAQQGSEGLFKVGNAAKVGKPFHLLITDLKMPEKDGLSMIKFLQSSGLISNTWVIMLTGIADDRKVREIITQGVDDFILKPIDVEILKKKLMNLLMRATA
jgi:two-component system chemotaxis response regulator CheY